MLLFDVHLSPHLHSTKHKKQASNENTYSVKTAYHITDQNSHSSSLNKSLPVQI